MNDTITLPFPDSRLSPNRRMDRRWITNVRQMARNTGYFLTKDANLHVPDKTPLHLYLTFCPPNHRRRDIDNLLSASKSTLDGMFQALGVDDSNVKLITMGMGKVVKEGQTVVRLEVIRPERK